MRNIAGDDTGDDAGDDAGDKVGVLVKPEVRGGVHTELDVYSDVVVVRATTGLNVVPVKGGTTFTGVLSFSCSSILSNAFSANNTRKSTDRVFSWRCCRAFDGIFGGGWLCSASRSV
jgi:hypothetical protein